MESKDQDMSSPKPLTMQILTKYPEIHTVEKIVSITSSTGKIE